MLGFSLGRCWDQALNRTELGTALDMCREDTFVFVVAGFARSLHAWYITISGGAIRIQKNIHVCLRTHAHAYSRLLAYTRLLASHVRLHTHVCLHTHVRSHIHLVRLWPLLVREITLAGFDKESAFGKQSEKHKLQDDWKVRVSEMCFDGLL